nr:STAS domain-containing protein [Alkalihalobacterium chitinilyticum]
MSELQPDIIEIILQNKADLKARWLKEIEAVRKETYMKNVTEHVFDSTNQEFVELILDTLHWSQVEATERIGQYSERLVRAGMQLEYITQGLQAFRRVILEMLTERESDSKRIVSLFYEIETWIDGIINKVIHNYSGSWQNTFELQKLSLLELSAPLIPIFENISIMPLIGTIDTARAKLIMENLLNGVIKHRAEVVLIDITGVPVVDTMVAHHIIQAAEAVRLVGSRCILVGIRPEIAQTIVNLGIDLSQFPTKSTLRKGVETAFELTNKRLVDL